MSYSENAFLSEDEKKKLKKSEKEKQQEREKILVFEKKKQEIREEEQTSQDLQKLRELLESHIIDDALVQKVLAGDEIDSEEMKNIFEKIDEIEKIEDIDAYIPQNMRISKEEYAAALHNEEDYQVVLRKLHHILGALAGHINPQTAGSFNIFSGFVTLLDKNLIAIQEHHIDIQNSLDTLPYAIPRKKESIWSILRSYFFEKNKKQ